jgi:hypothetical protein
MPGAIAIQDLVLNYEPEIPEERVRSAGLAVVSKTSIGRLPAPTSWPAFNDPTIRKHPAHRQAFDGEHAPLASAIVEVRRSSTHGSTRADVQRELSPLH